jgi:hypothetical protein
MSHSDRILIGQNNVEFREREVGSDIASRTTNICVECRYFLCPFGRQKWAPGFKKEPRLRQNYIPKAVCSKRFKERFGRTGEALCAWIDIRLQRIHSTRLPERDLVTGKRTYYNGAAEKGSKSTQLLFYCVAHSKSIDREKTSACTFNLMKIELGKKVTLSFSTGISRLDTLWKIDEKSKVYRLWKVLEDINLWIAVLILLETSLFI